MSEPGGYGVGIIGIVSYSRAAGITRNIHDALSARPTRPERCYFRTKNEINLRYAADAFSAGYSSRSGVFLL
jgi:hypothetical protein